MFMLKKLVEKLRGIHIQARVESLGVERLIDGRLVNKQAKPSHLPVTWLACCKGFF
jgi:hypothetical protein